MKTTVLFTRHEDHKDQVLLPDAVERARMRGLRLREKDYKIDRVKGSPLPRADATATEMMTGYGQTTDIEREARLGDFKSDPRTPKEAVKELKANAVAKHGDDSDSNLAKELINTPALHDLLFARAKEGAEALLEMAAANPGKTILAVSHGVARMEIVLRYLRGVRDTALLDIVPELIDRGEVIKLTFEVSEEWDDLAETHPARAEFVSAEPLPLL